MYEVVPRTSFEVFLLPIASERGLLACSSLQNPVKRGLYSNGSVP